MSEHDDKGFGFGGKNPAPARDSAMALAQTHLLLAQTTEELTRARRDAPSYTGQWSDSDYTAEAREAFNRAADDFEEAVVSSVLRLSMTLEGKRLALRAKVVGPWTPYNGSPYAKATRTGTSAEALVRFTPSEVYGVHRDYTSEGGGVEEPVVQVGPRMEPRAPCAGDYQMGDDEEYEADRAAFEREHADWGVNRWSWVVESRWREGEVILGFAPDREAACAGADAWLAGAGWRREDNDSDKGGV
jgi:hypothetical protein